LQLFSLDKPYLKKQIKEKLMPVSTHSRR